MPAERTVPMPEISREAKQDVFLVVLAEMIDNSVQRIQEQCPCLVQLAQGVERGR
jgi:hypothetical protein